MQKCRIIQRRIFFIHDRTQYGKQTQPQCHTSVDIKLYAIMYDRYNLHDKKKAFQCALQKHEPCASDQKGKQSEGRGISDITICLNTKVWLNVDINPGQKVRGYKQTGAVRCQGMPSCFLKGVSESCICNGCLMHYSLRKQAGWLSDSVCSKQGALYGNCTIE